MKAPNQFFRRQNLLRKYYFINIEVGLILSLLIITTLFRLDFYPEQEEIEYIHNEEIIQIEEIEQTHQESAPPPPPRRTVPIEVPNDEIIVDDQIVFNTELNFSDRLDVPPPPAKREEKKEGDEEEIFVVVEKMPELIGGIESIMDKIEYPELARRTGIEGRIVVQFVIDEKGNVVNPQIVRGIGGGCDEEAIEAVKQAKFTPGMQRGKPVKVQFSIPITFNLHKSS